MAAGPFETQIDPNAEVTSRGEASATVAASLPGLETEGGALAIGVADTPADEGEAGGAALAT